MESRDRPYREICAACERPALQWDDEGNPTCPEHADRFFPASGESDRTDDGDRDL